MKFVTYFRRAGRHAMIGAAWLCLGVASAFSAPVGKPVMVHYMPWFVSRPFSGSWGWHWTMNHYNPDAVGSDGVRPIASWYYPLIGPYDSADPTVLEYHVALMKLAGIDGVIVDWYGMDNYNDYAVNNQRTVDLFASIKRAGLSFSLCYEDATIKAEVSGKYIAASNAISHAQQTMLYVQTNFFQDPCFLRWSNQPVFLNFGLQYFTDSASWTSIFSVLNATNQPAFFTEDSRLLPARGAFDWPPMWMSSGNGGVVNDAMLQAYLTTFEQNSRSSAWPAFVSTAFPRFHDIYQQAGVSPSYGYLDDQSGNTLRETLGRAMTNSSVVIQIATWNDFGEGTIVEPTTQYGYRDLGIIQDYRRLYLDPAFPYHTNDLTLATRLFQLRQKFPRSNLIISAELDRVFTNIVSGRLAVASLQLTGVESNVPVIYDVSLGNGQLQFSLGGYLAAGGVDVQTSSNFDSTNWQTLNNLAVGTNQPMVNVPVSAQTAATFFRIRNGP